MGSRSVRVGDKVPFKTNTVGYRLFHCFAPCRAYWGTSYTSTSPLPPFENPPAATYVPFDRMQLTFSSPSTSLDHAIPVSFDAALILYRDSEPSRVHVTKLSESAKSLL